MRKVYSFGDVVKAYEGGYEGDFVSVNGNFRIQFGDTMTYIADHIPNEFIKADKKVDFMTAIKAFHGGKTVYNIITKINAKRVYSIYCEDGDTDYSLKDKNSFGGSICSAEILNGEWFIKNTNEE